MPTVNLQVHERINAKIILDNARKEDIQSHSIIMKGKERNMNVHTAEIKFTQVTPDVLEQFLATANRRIVIAKAGYSVKEIEQLLKLVNPKKITCDLYMEEGENAVRYGYGGAEALLLLKNNLDIINVQSANQIRMSIVIVDDAVLAYAPVALAWEEIPDKLEFPNGFFGGKSIADTLFKQIGGETIVLPLEKDWKFTISVPPIPLKKIDTIKAEIEKTSKGLDENPAVDPATLRATTFYRNRFKLLKMTMHGANVKNKSINLRPFNAMFPDANSRLKASWSVLTSKDAKKMLAIRNFLSTVEREVGKLTFNTGRHGKLIKRKDKHEIEGKIHNLVGELAENLDDEKKSTEQLSIFKNETGDLKTILEASKKSLSEYLYKLADEDEKCWDKLFAHERTLLRRMKAENTDPAKKKAIEQAIETFIEDTLKFPSPKDIIKSIKVDFDYYDVSDELLADKDFMNLLEKFDVEIREYSQGYEKKN